MSEANAVTPKTEVPVTTPAPAPKVDATPVVTPAITTPTQAEVKPAEKFSMPKGLAAELHKLREDRKQLREQLEAQKKATEDAKRPTNSPAIEEPSFIEDPERRLALEKERITSQVLSTIRSENEAAVRHQHLQEQGAKAIDYLMEQPEVNGDVEKFREVDAIIANDPELSEVARVSPLLAGKEALNRWKKDKGIDDASRSSAGQAIAAVATSKSSAALPSATRTAADIKADLARLHPNTPDFNNKWESLAKELAIAVK